MATPFLNYVASEFAKEGYRITSQSDTQMQLVKPKHFSCLLFGVLLLLGILPGILYAILEQGKAVLLTDIGNGIQSVSGSKSRFVSYEEINTGKSRKLLYDSNKALLYIMAGILGLAILGSLLNLPKTPVDPVVATVQAQEKATQNSIPTATKTLIPPTPTITYMALTNYEDFAIYKDKYKEKYVSFTCKAFHVLDDKQLQCMFPDDKTSVFIVSNDSYSEIYEDTQILVKGKSNGEHCGTNLLGGQVCAPLVVDAIVQKQ
ncbi:MAG: hypothetical protein VB108_01360 [Anaerolineaceae bacterium]|nr:hypothetical protein [Anaerolineaceae bacterium]